MFIEVVTNENEKMLINLVEVKYIKGTQSGCLIELDECDWILTKTSFNDIVEMIKRIV